MCCFVLPLSMWPVLMLPAPSTWIVSTVLVFLIHLSGNAAAAAAGKGGNVCPPSFTVVQESFSAEGQQWTACEVHASHHITIASNNSSCHATVLFCYCSVVVGLASLVQPLRVWHCGDERCLKRENSTLICLFFFVSVKDLSAPGGSMALVPNSGQTLWVPKTYEP